MTDSGGTRVRIVGRFFLYQDKVTTFSVQEQRHIGWVRIGTLERRWADDTDGVGTMEASALQARQKIHAGKVDLLHNTWQLTLLCSNSFLGVDGFVITLPKEMNMELRVSIMCCALLIDHALVREGKGASKTGWADGTGQRDWQGKRVSFQLTSILLFASPNACQVWYQEPRLIEP